jgi:hypothetical protein
VVKVKLSEAMILGSTFIKFDPNIYLVGQCGCLQGAGYAAATGKGFAQGSDIAAQWPWLKQDIDDPRFPGKSTCGTYVINAFAFAIKRGEMTLEEVVDWVRSVEPSEVIEPVKEKSCEGEGTRASLTKSNGL